MGKPKHYVKKRGGTNMHVNQNAHPFANTNNLPMAQMPMAQMPMANNNCPPCVCPPGNAEPENKPTSLTDTVMGFNNALATEPSKIFNSVQSNALNALNNKKVELSNNIIEFFKPKPAANAQPPNVGGRRRRTRRKRRGTKTKRRGTKTKRRTRR